jgi:hypothetical protein
MKASNRRNAFYWRFVELGTSNMPAHPLCVLRLMRGRKRRRAVIARMNKAIDEVLSK